MLRQGDYSVVSGPMGIVTTVTCGVASGCLRSVLHAAERVGGGVEIRDVGALKDVGP
jgi:hypothetical protein